MAHDRELTELRGLLRAVVRGLRRRHRDARLGPRHLAVLAFASGEQGRTVGEVAQALGLSLPAASRLTRDLEDAGLLRRREDPADRRRTVVEAARQAEAWIADRDRPLAAALDALSAPERAAFLKGLSALAEALMEESPHGSVGPHHLPSHRRGPHRHRPL